MSILPRPPRDEGCLHSVVLCYDEARWIELERLAEFRRSSPPALPWGEKRHLSSIDRLTPGVILANVLGGASGDEAAAVFEKENRSRAREVVVPHYCLDTEVIGRGSFNKQPTLPCR